MAGSQSRLAFLPASPLVYLCASSTRPRPQRSTRCTAGQPPPKPTTQSGRDQLYSILSSASRRTKSDSQLAPLIPDLESLSQTNTVSSPQLLGTWRNVHTTTPSSSSIIQRTVVSSTFVPRVEQVIHPGSEGRPSKILNRVDLRTALGCILNVRAAVEHIDDCRLLIRFDRAWFQFDRLPAWLGAATLRQPVNIPYPVPFRLLGKKACGWLDVTYLDSTMRVSRGNRGSSFVLIKDEDNLLPIQSDDLE